MAQSNLNSNSISFIYKMDNVLYEIHDNRGISKHQDFEPWKTEVISSLEAAEFITVKDEKYVLTREGCEVINCDSLVYYKQGVRANNQETEQEPKTFFQKLFLEIGAKLHW